MEQLAESSHSLQGYRRGELGGFTNRRLDQHGSYAGRISLSQKFRLTLLRTHPTDQDKQRVAQAIEKPHESRIQRLCFPKRTHTFRLSADRSGLMQQTRNVLSDNYR